MKKLYTLLILFCLTASALTAQTTTEVVGGVSGAYGLALQGNDMYVSAFQGNKIFKFDISDPNPILQEVATVTAPADIALYGNYLYIVTNASGIYKIDLTEPTPMVVNVISTFNTLYGIQIIGDEFYYGNASLNRIEKINLMEASPTPAVVVSGLILPAGLALKGNQLYIAEGGGGKISGINLTDPTPTPTTVATGLAEPIGLALNGNFLYTSVVGGLAKIDLTQENPSGVSVPGVSLNNPYVTLFNDGIMYITNGNSVYKVEGLTPSFSLPEQVCADGATVTSGGASPTGGVYSGTGVTDDGNGETFTFDFAGQGAGMYTITYNLNGATNTAILDVAQAPTVTFTAPGPFDIDAGVQALTGGMPTGGVYSGNGVTDDGNGMTYSFDPVAAGVGENVITYTYADANGCGGAQGAIITVTAGVAGAALDFDGVDDRVVIPHENLLDNLTGDYTISAWVNIDDNTVNQPVFGYGINSALGYINLSANTPALGNVPLFVFNDIAGDKIVSGSEALTVNVWHYLLVSYEAASTTLTLYVDGEVAGTNTNVPSVPADFQLNGAYLGYFPQGSIFGYFSGQMDEVRITNTASSCYAVQQQADCELASDDTALELYYQFNQGVAGGDNTAITELIATAGPNGTLSNFALTGDASNFIEQGGVVTGTTCDPTIVMPVVNVTGNGITIANEDNSPVTDDSTDMGDVVVGDMTSVTFTITNTGNGDLEILNPSSSNSLFTVTYTAPDLTVTFSPDAVGNQTSTIAFENNDCTSGSNFSFAVQANGACTPAVVNNIFINAFTSNGISFLVVGDLNDNTNWSWYLNSCDGEPFQTLPSIATGYIDVSDVTSVWVRGEDNCGNGDCFEFDITTTFTPSVTANNTCVDSGVQDDLAGGMPAGGAYSGPGVTDNADGMTYTFDPETAGVGVHTISYMIGGVTVTTEMEVFEMPVFTVINVDTGVEIADGDDTPSVMDGTDFGDLQVGATLTTDVQFELTNGMTFVSASNDFNGQFGVYLPGGNIVTVNFSPFEAGETFGTIFLDYMDCTGPHRFSFVVRGNGTVPVANNECEGSEDLNILFGQAFDEPQTSGTYDNTNATNDESDPDFGWECFGEPDGGGAAPSLERTLWFSFTGDGNTYYITTVECESTDFIDAGDTQMAIYSGTACDDLTAVACNEDGPDATDGFFPAGLELATEPGVTYLMMIDGFGPDFPADGEFCMEVTNKTPNSVTNIQDTEIDVYPNPTDGIVLLKEVEAVWVDVFDQLGRIVAVFDHPVNQLDITELPTGVYSLRIQAKDGEVYAARVIKD